MSSNLNIDMISFMNTNLMLCVPKSASRSSSVAFTVITSVPSEAVSSIIVVYGLFSNFGLLSLVSLRVIVTVSSPL